MMEYTLELSDDAAMAMHERGLDRLEKALVDGGTVVESIVLSLNPPCVKVAWSGGVDPATIVSRNLLARRDKVRAREVIQAFCADEDAGRAITRERLSRVLRAFATILELD